MQPTDEPFQDFFGFIDFVFLSRYQTVDNLIFPVIKVIFDSSSSAAWWQAILSAVAIIWASLHATKQAEKAFENSLRMKVQDENQERANFMINTWILTERAIESIRGEIKDKPSLFPRNPAIQSYFMSVGPSKNGYQPNRSIEFITNTLETNFPSKIVPPSFIRSYLSVIEILKFFNRIHFDYYNSGKSDWDLNKKLLEIITRLEHHLSNMKNQIDPFMTEHEINFPIDAAGQEEVPQEQPAPAHSQNEPPPSP